MGQMSSASSKGYISKRKIDYMNKKKERKASLVENPIAEEDEGFNSNVEISDEDLDNFAEKEGGMKLSEDKEELKKKRKKRNRHKQEVDTNVVSIRAENLNDKVEYATGDPYYCSKCGAIFNKFSILKEEDGSKIWNCEFCTQRNQLLIEEEEYPKSHYLTYLLEAKEAVAPPPELEEDISVIFCIDVSGSMDCTQFYKGEKMKYMTNPNFITRIQCVKVAIDDQLGKMYTNPSMSKRKVGFVTFANNVTILGDQSGLCKTYDGPVLDNFSTLLEDSIDQAKNYLSLPLTKSFDYLLNTLKNITTGGSTALGPALLVSSAIASQGKPGSRVIICTDGLANRGLGNLDKKEKALEESQEFYTQVAHYAKAKGITISLITLVGEGCRLDMLSPVANLTGGDIIRVDPLNLRKDFEEVLQERVIATNVGVKVILHKALQFRNEDEKNLSETKNILNREIGNATKDTIITFEYSVKPPKELLAIPDFNLSDLKVVPLQAQIIYRDAQGRKCLRLLSQSQEVTNEKEEAIKHADKKVLGAHIELKAAEKAEKGDFRGAQAHAFGYAQMAGNQKDLNDNFMGLYQALESEQLANEKNDIEVPIEKTDKLAEVINKAYRQKKK